MQPESAPRPWKGMILVVAALAVVVAGTLTLLGSQVGAVLSTVGASVGSPIDAGGGQPGNGNGGGGGGGSGENGGSSGGDGAQGGPLQLLDSARPDLLVIKTGELTLQVDAIDPALSAAIRTVDRLGGYVSGSSRRAPATRPRLP